MKAICLAAGYGTRLYPLTQNTPKPLIKIANVPILERILRNIEEVPEIDEVFIVTNDKFYKTISSWLEGMFASSDFRKKIATVNDGTSTNESRLGPIGDIIFVLEKYNIQDDLMIIAGDNLFDMPLAKLYQSWKSQNGTLIGIYDFQSIERVKNKFGVVLIDDQKRILSFEEKPSSPKSSLAATALYLLRKCDVDLIKDFYLKEGNHELNSGDLIKELLRQGVPIHGELIDQWFDIGSPDDLKHAESYYMQK
jgi:glucose-1-phosphate thymidylyltransferase